MEHGLFLTGIPKYSAIHLKKYRFFPQNFYIFYSGMEPKPSFCFCLCVFVCVCVCVLLSKLVEAYSLRICVIPVYIVVPTLVASVINYFD